MAGTTKHESELLSLLSAIWDDGLDSASRARLEELLARDDLAAIELLTSYTRLHLDLEWLMSSQAAQEKALATLKQATLTGNRKGRRRWEVKGLAGLAAVIFIALFGRWYFARPGIDQLTRSPQPVGQVVRLENAAWANGAGPQTNDAVRESQIVDLQSGIAQLSMGFGADIVMEGPCRIQLLSDDRVALKHGKLAVRAAKWAIGFRVETDNLVATDLGTWFSVQSGSGMPAEIHVLEGSVLAEQLKKGGSKGSAHRVNADEALHMNRDGEFQSIQFRRDSAAGKLSSFRPLRPIQIWNTGIGLREGEVDPHWKVTQGDDRAGSFPQTAVVSVPHISYGINEPERSQWISVERGTTRGVPARSKYTFETAFDLTGFDLNSVWVSGLVLADDGVDEVWLNDKRLSIKSWTDWTYGINYVNFHPVEIRRGFVQGVNRLAFVVKNESFIVPTEKGFDVPDTPNPMALRVEWQAFGRPLSETK